MDSVEIKATARVRLGTVTVPQDVIVIGHDGIWRVLKAGTVIERFPIEIVDVDCKVG